MIFRIEEEEFRKTAYGNPNLNDRAMLLPRM